PPVASALDPLHYLASMAVAQQREGLESVGPGEGFGDRVVLDVRLSEEVSVAQVQAPRVVCIPVQEVTARMGELSGRDIVVICEKGPRSLEVARRLRASGLKAVRYAAGGRAFRAGELG
ncbi:MAG: rhodanese-like domain-containing protein, partial [Polyangiaceae bacterium]|nr:rhodanese-like domain-containing protein [Polyangiaceae bacterium]